jgi:lipopolysaccharide export system permease protein
MLIFVLQAIWLYIKELAGKDLDVATVLKFLFYVTPTLIPLILPLTILLSSIMVFGSFAENYEFAAMKSTGISLQRAMMSLSIFIGFLALTTFFFSNNVIPWAEYESYNLRKNIAKLKPAMVIAEGQFNNIGDDFNIKVEEKSGDNGQFLKNIIIHQKTSNRSTNHKTTIAKNGELLSAEDSNILKLVLLDGYYYDDSPPKDIKERRKYPFTKTYFKKYVTNIDLSQLNNIDLDDKQTTDKYSMLDILDLNYAIDSLKRQRIRLNEEFSTTILKRTNLESLNQNVSNDSLKASSLDYKTNILSVFEPKRQVQILDYAINTLTSTTSIIENKKLFNSLENNYLNKHGLALHKKFALAAACIILFFVGAPLGALIRKGGMGLPLVIAVVLFLTYHFIGLFAENSAKSGSLNPVLAAWFSTLIMFPLSVFLTRRATADRGIFEFDHIIEPLKNKLGISSKNNKIQKPLLSQALTKDHYDKAISLYQATRVNANIALISYALTIVLAILYFVFKNNELPALSMSSIQLSIFAFVIYSFSFIKVIILKKRYIKLAKESSLSILSILGGYVIFPLMYFKLIHTKYQVLELEAHSKDQEPIFNKELVKTPDSIKMFKNYKKTSLIALISFVFTIILIPAYFILKNNKLEALGESGIQLSVFTLIIFIVFCIKSILLLNNYLKYIGLKEKTNLEKISAFIAYPYFYNINKKIVESSQR